jgi:hypothetical protein
LRQAQIDIEQQQWIEAHAEVPCLHVGCGEKPIPWAVNIDPNHSRTRWRDFDYDVCTLPFGDGCFRSIVSSHVLPAIYDLDRAMVEMIRVLEVGGIMAHVIPDWRYTPKRKDPRFEWDYQRQGWDGPEKFGIYVAQFPELETLELVSFQDFRWSFKWLARKVVIDGIEGAGLHGSALAGSDQHVVCGTAQPPVETEG